MRGVERRSGSRSSDTMLDSIGREDIANRGLTVLSLRGLVYIRVHGEEIRKNYRYGRITDMEGVYTNQSYPNMTLTTIYSNIYVQFR